MADDRPTFLILRPLRMIPLSDPHGRNLLGQLCTFMSSPLEGDLVPEKPQDFLEDEPVIMLFQNLQLLLSSVHNREALLRLKNAVGIDVDVDKTKDSTMTTAMQSKFTRVVRLPQPTKTLKRLLAEPNILKAVQGRLTLRKRWYMVVGYITCFDADIALQTDKARSAKFNGKFSTETIASLLSGLPIPTGLAPSESASASRTTQRNVLLTGHVPGESIFAIEYLTLHKSSIWHYLVDTFIGRIPTIDADRSGLVYHSEAKAMGDSDDDSNGDEPVDEEIDDVETYQNEQPDSLEDCLRKRGFEKLFVSDSAEPAAVMQRMRPTDGVIFYDEAPEDFKDDGFVENDLLSLDML